MKKVLVITVVLSMLATSAFAVISNGGHDLGSAGWRSDTDVTETCVVCHTPHNATQAIPLWNRSAVGTTFTAYNSSTMDSSDSGAAPSGISLMCLSCHDGATGLENFGGVTGGALTFGTEGYAAAANFGTDLSDDHPISIDYDESAGFEMQPAASTVMPGNGGAFVSAFLFGNKVECASCHDVHADNNGAADPYMLVTGNNNNSQLCIACHEK